MGLGNPGEEYMHNRHNAGFMFVEYLAGKEASWKSDKYTGSKVFELDNIILAEPQTFMNKSGEAVQKLLEHYDITPDDLIVAHDELDLLLGDFKVNRTGSPLHNGLTSIVSHLKDGDFLRVRIGVDARTPEHRMQGEKYVLEDFMPAEQMQLEKIFPAIRQRLWESL